ncbi:MAG: hypothetical protein KKB82_00455 [Candidatus Omnitrophica bacterium]|nr:hypothetical protein [Candidatus Omnitrophota bacterium]MBU1924373.1 hypothetical protein [Candidatus Omnitrophota bacterium]MBU2063867.1 hypothetical protein [Candidatus Omnitrophota bacterium]
MQKKFICHDCFRLKKCQESFVSWIFFFLGVVATISIRAVNITLSFNPLMARIFWYVGVAGFLLFFIYKFNYYNITQQQIKDCNLVEKLLEKNKLDGHDYEVLGTIICALNSKKDKINFFLIFLFSALALVVAVYIDFIK